MMITGWHVFFAVIAVWFGWAILMWFRDRQEDDSIRQMILKERQETELRQSGIKSMEDNMNVGNASTGFPPVSEALLPQQAQLSKELPWVDGKPEKNGVYVVAHHHVGCKGGSNTMFCHWDGSRWSHIFSSMRAFNMGGRQYSAVQDHKYIADSREDSYLESGIRPPGYAVR